MAVVDATNLLLGRMASVIAKRALKGEKIDIVNCEKAVVSGNKNHLVALYTQKQRRGNPFRGPFFPKQSDRILRRTIKGMLPHRKAHGREAFERVMCHIGVPEKLKNEKMETIEIASVSKLPLRRCVALGEIAKLIGGKV